MMLLKNDNDNDNDNDNNNDIDIDNNNDIDDLKIDNITFKLKKKINYGSKLMVLIESKVDDEPNSNEFLVYRSVSDIGFWRLAFIHFIQPTILYKGSEDYIQQTFICFELQTYINNNIDNNNLIEETIGTDIFMEYYHYFEECKIPSEDETYHWFYKILMNSELQNIIDNETRSKIIENEDMIKILKESYDHRCGYEIKKEYIEQISDKLEELYELYEKVDDFEPINYNIEINLDGKIIKINGKIHRVLLESKSSREINLLLYYIDINTNIDMDIPLEFSNSLPVLVTTVNSKINSYGIYTEYVKLQSYICKLFEYKTQVSNPSDQQEISDKYVYMGNFYKNLFPLKDNFVEI